MRRSRFKLKAQNSTFALNITSMTDMFTIMLVFLLQTYSTSDMQVIPEKDINLPVSNIEITPPKTMSVSLSRKELKLDGRTIASLDDGDFSKLDIDSHDMNFIKPLFNELSKLEKAETTVGAKEGNILMQADSSLSYQVIRKVMYTASMAGFPKLKMATVAGE